MDTFEHNGGAAQPASGLTETAIRTAEQFCQLNVNAASVILQGHAQAASALGMPDWSAVLAASSEQARQVLSASTEQWVEAAHQAELAVGALQRNTSQLVEDQSSRAADLLQTGMEELTHQTRENLERMEAWQAEGAERSTSGVTAIEGWAQMTADAMDLLPRPDLRLAPLPQAVQGVLPAGPN